MLRLETLGGLVGGESPRNTDITGLFPPFGGYILGFQRIMLAAPPACELISPLSQNPLIDGGELSCWNGLLPDLYS